VLIAVVLALVLIGGSWWMKKRLAGSVSKG
jgi:hypothetical protein